MNFKSYHVTLKRGAFKDYRVRTADVCKFNPDHRLFGLYCLNCDSGNCVHVAAVLEHLDGGIPKGSVVRADTNNPHALLKVQKMANGIPEIIREEGAKKSWTSEQVQAETDRILHRLYLACGYVHKPKQVKPARPRDAFEAIELY